MNSERVVCLVTCPVGDSDVIASAIIAAKNAACVNIVSTVRSVYWWEGKVESDEEALLVIKTTSSLVGVLKDQLDEIHPYDTFELVATPITDGNPPYLEWISDSVVRA